ncbi:MAG: hypothetical protein HY944_02430 [Gemmatimonadetes bacterium]|nr:hypothetical protein [Gemmatimonadota bacterium]
MLGPGMPAAGGWMRLLGLDLAAFHAGRVTMAVFTTQGAEPAADVALQAR